MERVRESINDLRFPSSSSAYFVWVRTPVVMNSNDECLRDRVNWHAYCVFPQLSSYIPPMWNTEHKDHSKHWRPS